MVDHDVSLAADGEQTVGVVLDPEQKLEIARLLDDLRLPIDPDLPMEHASAAVAQLSLDVGAVGRGATDVQRERLVEAAGRRHVARSE